MNRYTSLLLLTSLFFTFDPAYSIFGAEDVPLEDYYEFGRHQTGVASVRVKKGSKTGLGTANLIDLKDMGIPSLQDRLGSLEGRVLITAAHVLYDKDLEFSSIRFMTENNESQTVEVEDFFIPDDYRVTGDIGFIVLKEPVDISKFKPLKLNLSKENRSLSGKEVNVFGCTSIFGKVNSSIVIRESNECLLRRGMTSVLGGCANDSSELSASFYTSKGVIHIFRDSTKALTEKDEAKQREIEAELKRVEEDSINTASVVDKLSLAGKRYELSQESFNLRPVEVRKMLSQRIFYNGENVQDQLNRFEDTDDLDKPGLISQWENFINHENSGYKSMDIGKYQVKFYGPPLRLNGLIYHGDSGGAWVMEDEIVGVTAHKFKFDEEKLQVKQSEPLNPALGIHEYFTQCENIISKSQSQISADTHFETTYITSIWSCRDWIVSTLEEIIQSIEKRN